MRKNLAVDIPKDAETEVDRIRGLKKSIFTRTRIATLCLVMVVALSVTGTLAFESWTGNATPNRGNLGKVEVKIGERVGLSTAQSASAWDKDNDYSYGIGNKVVCFKAPSDRNEVTEDVTVSIVPEVVSKKFYDATTESMVDPDVAQALAGYNGMWTAVKSENGEQWVESDVMRIYLTNIGDGENQWTMQSDGTFKYNSSLSRGETTSDLLKGIVLLDGAEPDNYQSVQVKVIARALETLQNNES